MHVIQKNYADIFLFLLFVLFFAAAGSEDEMIDDLEDEFDSLPSAKQNIFKLAAQQTLEKEGPPPPVSAAQAVKAAVAEGASEGEVEAAGEEADDESDESEEEEGIAGESEDDAPARRVARFERRENTALAQFMFIKEKVEAALKAGKGAELCQLHTQSKLGRTRSARFP
jgi:hypothetical protein